MKKLDPIQKLEEMKSLKPGWDSYGGLPPNEATIEKTKQFVYKCLENELVPSRVSPSCAYGKCMGTTALTFRNSDDDRYPKAYIEFYDDGRACVLFCRETEESIRTKMVEDDDHLELIEEIKEYIQ